MSQPANPTLAPEIELIILATRQHLNTPQRARIGELIGRDLDWDLVLRRSRPLGIHGFLRRHLVSDGLRIPARVTEYFEQQYRFQAIANLRIWTQLREIGEAFNRAGIRMAVLKGAFLAYWIYDDPALRPVGDLDLLCQEQDWGGVKEVMRSLGYAQKPQTPGDEFFTLHPPGFIRGTLPTVEVHTSLRGLWRGDELLSRSCEAERDAVFFQTLGFVDLVRYLIAHIAQHNALDRLPLFWFADIHEVIGRSRTPLKEHLETVLSQARRDTSTALVWSFLERYWLDAPGLDDTTVSRSHAEFLERIARQSTSYASAYSRALRNIRYWPGIGVKIRYLMRLVFPPIECFAARERRKLGMGIYLRYFTRFFSIPARIIWSALRGRRSP